jgi:hypothetical protein
LPNNRLYFSYNLFCSSLIDSKSFVHKTQPESILRAMPLRLINDKKQRPVSVAILHQTPVADIVADSARGIGDLIQSAGGSEVNEVGRRERGIVGEENARHDCEVVNWTIVG